MLFIGTALFHAAQAWTDNGHMLVAQIAKMLLGDEKLSQLSEHFYSQEYLDMRPKGFPKVENTDDLAGIAVWMDNVNVAFPYQKHWHFVDQMLSLDGTQCEGKPIGQDDIIWGLGEALHILQIAHLHYTDPAALQFFHGYWLRVLVHLMGDLHQPLHNCSGCSKDFPEGDRGGNEWKIRTDIVNKFHGHKKNVDELHLLWDLAGGLYQDNWPLDDEKRETLERTAKELVEEFPESSFPDPKYTNKHSFLRWHNETYSYTPKVYEAKFGEHITDDYLTFVQQTSKRQIALGGYRLASILRTLPETYNGAWFSFDAAKREMTLDVDAGAKEKPWEQVLYA